jgi:hypothetical protein
MQEQVKDLGKKFLDHDLVESVGPWREVPLDA